MGHDADPVAFQAVVRDQPVTGGPSHGHDDGAALGELPHDLALPVRRRDEDGVDDQDHRRDHLTVTSRTSIPSWPPKMPYWCCTTTTSKLSRTATADSAPPALPRTHWWTTSGNGSGSGTSTTCTTPTAPASPPRPVRDCARERLKVASPQGVGGRYSGLRRTRTWRAFLGRPRVDSRRGAQPPARVATCTHDALAPARRGRTQACRDILVATRLVSWGDGETSTVAPCGSTPGRESSLATLVDGLVADGD